MRDSVKEAIASTVTDMIEADLKVSFTQKELHKMGIKVAPVSLSPEEISRIRKPSGSTMILLELLQKEPYLLDYRIGLHVA